MYQTISQFIVGSVAPWAIGCFLAWVVIHGLTARLWIIIGCIIAVGSADSDLRAQTTPPQTWSYVMGPISNPVYQSGGSEFKLLEAHSCQGVKFGTMEDLLMCVNNATSGILSDWYLHALGTQNDKNPYREMKFYYFPRNPSLTKFGTNNSQALGGFACTGTQRRDFLAGGALTTTCGQLSFTAWQWFTETGVTTNLIFSANGFTYPAYTTPYFPGGGLTLHNPGVNANSSVPSYLQSGAIFPIFKRSVAPDAVEECKHQMNGETHQETLPNGEVYEYEPKYVYPWQPMNRATRDMYMNNAGGQFYMKTYLVGKGEVNCSYKLHTCWQNKDAKNPDEAFYCSFKSMKIVPDINGWLDITKTPLAPVTITPRDYIPCFDGSCDFTPGAPLNPDIPPGAGEGGAEENRPPDAGKPVPVPKEGSPVHPASPPAVTPTEPGPGVRECTTPYYHPGNFNADGTPNCSFGKDWPNDPSFDCKKAFRWSADDRKAENISKPEKYTAFDCSTPGAPGGFSGGSGGGGVPGARPVPAPNVPGVVYPPSSGLNPGQGGPTTNPPNNPDGNGNGIPDSEEPGGENGPAYSEGGSFYTSKYPGGLGEILARHRAAAGDGNIGEALAAFTFQGTGGSGPICYELFGERFNGAWLSQRSICIPEWLILLMKAIMLLSAAIAARSIVFGG